VEPRSIALLLIDDDEDDYLIIKNQLSKIIKPRFDVEWVADAEVAKDRIAANQHDIYLVDYRLGPANGLELLSDFDLSSRTQPFIILTGAGDSRIEEDAMQIGVADYLVKGSFDVALLSRALRYSLQRKLIEMQRLEHYRDINRSKDEFIALASHQLRTPATAVKQYIGMLLEGYAGKTTKTQKSYLESAYTSNERQLKVVDDILRVAQLDLNKVTLHTEATDMGKFMTEACDDMIPIMKDRDQQLQLKLPVKTPCCEIDPMHLLMAITNLLDNASKYSHAKQTVTVGVSTEKNEAVITIRDEGVGISPADHDKLFMKFSRIPNPLSIAVGGTGLGLYWSNQIIMLHGGTIGVESKLDQGTTFTINLPLAKPAKK
jgi:two-component system sensor histidine kinase/response regulator